jgi:glycosyltransferase involved in cell wall biosynthesis
MDPALRRAAETSGPTQTVGVAVVIPAREEAERIGETVRSAFALPGVDAVVVVDDGSRDDTARLAGEAGALVRRHRRRRGKGAAMETGAAAVVDLDAAASSAARPGAPRHLLFLDADLGESAWHAGPLVAPVLHGEADMTVAVLPPQRDSDGAVPGGRGRVVRLARAGIQRATGWTPTQPLSGQRCLTRAAFEAARPLAYGFGVETALTVDLLRRGFRVVEVSVPLAHRVTAADLSGRIHRARQYAHVRWALLRRRRRRRRPR